MKLRRCDIVRGAAALLFFLLFFVWGTAGRFWQAVTIYFPAVHLLVAAAIALAFIAPVRSAVVRFREWLIPRRYRVFPLVAFCATILISLLVFDGIPHIQDSIHYRFMALNLLHGQLHHPMIAHYEFFRFLYFIPDGEKIYSLFLPGYSFFLIPFVGTGLAVLANPLLTAGTVALCGRIAETLFGPRIAAAAMAFAVGSIFLMVMGGTFMAHPFCAFLTLLTVYLFLRSRREPSGRRGRIFAAIAGLAAGWLLFTRPQNTLFLLIPLALVWLWEVRRAVAPFTRLFFFAVAFLPWLMLLLVNNHYYTGDPLLFKQDPYFNYSEPTELCHRFGLYRGCHNSNWSMVVMPDEGLTPAYALHVSYRRLSPLLLHTFGHPLLFLLVVLAFLFPCGPPRRELFLAALFLSTVAGYFFFYFDGNVFGPRYYYETAFFLPILAARGLSAFGAWIATRRRPLFFAAPVGGLIAGGYLFAALFVLPPLFHTYRTGFWEVETSLSAAVEQAGLHNAVVFIDPELLYGSGMAIMRHHDWERNDVVYVRDLGDRSNSALMHHLAGRSFYRARFSRWGRNGLPPAIVPLEGPSLPSHYLVVEMEDKHYPLRGSPDYCNEYPSRPELARVHPFPDADTIGIGFSKKGFFCRFRDTAQYYTFGQQLFVSGRYTIDLIGVAGPAMGRFRVAVDDRPVGTVDFSGDRYEKVTRTVTADLAEGFRLIRLEPEEVRGDTYFLLDAVEFFTPLPDPEERP